jgi:hypothetical protein
MKSVETSSQLPTFASEPAKPATPTVTLFGTNYTIDQLNGNLEIIRFLENTIDEIVYGKREFVLGKSLAALRDDLKGARKLNDEVRKTCTVVSVGTWHISAKVGADVVYYSQYNAKYITADAAVRRLFDTYDTMEEVLKTAQVVHGVTGDEKFSGKSIARQRILSLDEVEYPEDVLKYIDFLFKHLSVTEFYEALIANPEIGADVRPEILEEFVIKMLPAAKSKKDGKVEKVEISVGWTVS